jgi:hypothetical protein
MDELWFEDMLHADAETLNTLRGYVKSVDADIENQLEIATRGVVRVYKPRWVEIDAKQYELLPSGKNLRFYLVRLGFEFDVVRGSQLGTPQFISATCQVHLWSADGGDDPPEVYSIFPERLEEGPRRPINLKFAPKLKIAELELSLGEISTDVAKGMVEPAVIGHLGEHERAPYWRLEPKSKSLNGIQHLWLTLALPSAAMGCQIAPLVVGELQTSFGIIRIGPRTKNWDSQYAMLLQLDSP